MDLVPHIYHEKQEPGSMLCGQHALNNLLQTSLFTPQDLADIARQIDAMEAAQLVPGTRLRGEGGVLSGESQNFDDSGFFSVQVMEEALKLLGLRLVRWGSKEMANLHNTPEQIEAFLLNHQLHWFSIRRFATPERFYNLDSCAQQPVWVSSMYLGLCLKEAENQGYSIFAVVPAPDSNVPGLPPCSAADKALNLPPPHGGGGSSSSASPYASSSSSAAYNPWSGNGHSLSAASSSSARSPFSSALNPNTSSSSAARKGKRPASVDISIDDDDDDDIIIEEPESASGGSSSGSGGSGGKRRKVEGSNGFGGGTGGGGMGEEEEMMARAIRESLNVSGGAGGGGGTEGTSSGGATGGQTPLSRAAQSEEDDFERAIRASLADSGQDGAVGGGGGESQEVDEDDHVQDDSPTMEELRRRRLARFGA